MGKINRVLLERAERQLEGKLQHKEYAEEQLRLIERDIGRFTELITELKALSDEEYMLRQIEELGYLETYALWINGETMMHSSYGRRWAAKPANLYDDPLKTFYENLIDGVTYHKAYNDELNPIVYVLWVYGEKVWSDGRCFRPEMKLPKGEKPNRKNIDSYKRATMLKESLRTDLWHEVRY